MGPHTGLASVSSIVVTHLMSVSVISTLGLRSLTWVLGPVLHCTQTLLFWDRMGIMVQCLRIGSLVQLRDN